MSDGASLDILGMDEILSRVEYMGHEGDRAINKCLKKGGKIFLEEIKSRAPTSRSPRQPKKKTQLWRTGKHAKDILKIGGIKKANGNKFLLVGIQKNDNSKAFYLKFKEFGSSKEAAKPFMAPAYESKKDEVKEAIKEELKIALKL